MLRKLLSRLIGGQARRKRSESSAELGRTVAVTLTLLKTLEEAVGELGHEDAIRFMMTTRGDSEARAAAALVMQVLSYDRGEVRDAAEALRVTDTLAMIIFGELGNAAEQLGHENNGFECLRVTKGDEFAMALLQKFLVVSARYEAAQS
ncbi:MAG: hypothetical protein CME04_19670 [Gemmatimonadaceae bacterium]|jgi:hypothetical protein|nr:hypothetical protein [Gemmatimonadaceae bacterium]